MFIAGDMFKKAPFIEVFENYVYFTVEIVRSSHTLAVWAIIIGYFFNLINK